MSHYHPDVWVIVKLSGSNPEDSHYRVLCGWYGGYAGSDSWKMNSGITTIREEDGCWVFEGKSGSSYICGKNTEKFSGYTHSIYMNYHQQNTEEFKIEHVPFSTMCSEFGINLTADAPGLNS